VFRTVVPTLAGSVTRAASQLSASSPTSAAVTSLVGYALAQCCNYSRN
jgi:hypothetical protein